MNMTAQQAREAAREALYETTEGILLKIEILSRRGHTSLPYNWLKPETIDQLRILGYKVKRDWEFIFPSDTYTISWK